MKTQTAETTRYPEIVTPRMVDEAIVIAQTITGLDGYGGARQYRGTPGLVCLVQEYIDTCRETRGCGLIAYEFCGEYHVGYDRN